ncbi:T6SS phospholipase effector Tle1-like catalytic domain-containing protein [Rahnella sp. PD4]|uniref:T6SS phospholipase effector Tle1-like catalytic domain-containing protein n=1 Tax=Rahnella sp. PD4 TaxID=3368611 RepID=UPI003BA0102D
MAQRNAWEVTDGQHISDVNVSEKIVICKRKEVPGITITIGMFFDGTGNNVFNTDKRLLETCTSLDVGMKTEDAVSCVEKLGKSGNGAGSYLGYYSNLHWLNTLYIVDDEITNEQLLYQRAIYIQGVGTQRDKQDSLVGMGIGAWFEGVVDKTDEGISQIASEISLFLRKNNNSLCAIEKIQFDIFGFSRGAAAARHLANRVRNNDQAIQEAITKGLDGRNQHGKPSGEVRFLGLFDTVCAVGAVTNLFDVHGGVNPGIELALPKDIAQKVFQITAMHECRYNFSLNSIKESWPELALPGVHSDIGGGYNPQEKEYLFLSEPGFETVRDSIPVEMTNIYRSSAAEIPDLRVLPNLSPIMLSGVITLGTWYDYLVNPNKNRMGVTEKRVGAAVTMERTVTNDWSKVSLRVMLDVGQTAGIIFQAIDPSSPDMKLPEELESLCNKAIKQGKAVITGGESVSFTLEEMQLIGKYIHCSANWNAVVFKDVWLDGNKVKAIYGAVKPVELVGFVNRPNPGWVRAVWNMQGAKA